MLDDFREPSARAGPDETSQQWLTRQLRRVLPNVPDQVVKDFTLRQDVTLLRNFMTGIEKRRAAFILVEEVKETVLERRFFEENAIPTADLPNERVDLGKMDQQMEKALQNLTLNINDADFIKKKRRPKIIKKLPAKPKRRKKRRTKKSRKSKKTGPRKKLVKARPKAKEEVPSGPVAPEPAPAQPEPESRPTRVSEQVVPDFLAKQDKYVLKWYNGSDIPTGKFVFLATRDEPAATKNDFDKHYMVGFMQKDDDFQTVLNKARMLIEELGFEWKVDVLIQLEINTGSQRPERWLIPDRKFESFLSESLVEAVALPAKKVGSEWRGYEAEGESINSMLKTRIKTFCRNTIKLELSLYELNFVPDDMFSEGVPVRVQRITSLLAVIAMLYKDSAREFVQDVVFLSVELVCRTLAFNVHQRIRRLICGAEGNSERKRSYLTDEQHLNIVTQLTPLLWDLLRLGKDVLKQKSDEYVCLKKIEQCLKVIEYILDEFNSLKEVIDDLRREDRDMTLNREPLDQINNLCKSYFESSLESGNYDAMKNVCLRMVDLLAQIKEKMPALDTYCTDSVSEHDAFFEQ